MSKEFNVKSTEGKEFTISVHKQIDDTSDMDSFLTSEWCTCPEPEFLCYPKDGCCTCGVHKHHVHCKHCGGISQIG